MAALGRTIQGIHPGIWHQLGFVLSVYNLAVQGIGASG
jgi:hypothetical protein